MKCPQPQQCIIKKTSHDIPKQIFKKNFIFVKVSIVLYLTNNSLKMAKNDTPSY